MPRTGIGLRGLRPNGTDPSSSGHQALAEFFGGRLRRIEHPFHGHDSPIRLTEPDEPFWKGVPNDAVVGRYHSWVVEDTDLPDCLIPTAWSDDDGVLMAMRHKLLPHYGVQFHPESIISDCGERLIWNWLDIATQIRKT